MGLRVGGHGSRAGSWVPTPASSSRLVNGASRSGRCVFVVGEGEDRVSLEWWLSWLRCGR